MEREEAERRELRKMMMEGALGGKKKDKDSADSPALPPGVRTSPFSQCSNILYGNSIHVDYEALLISVFVIFLLVIQVFEFYV